jgi:UPF0755 protein
MTGPRDPYDYDRIFEEPLEPEPKFYERVPRRYLIQGGISLLVVIVLIASIVHVKHAIDPGGEGPQVNVDVAKGSSFGDVAGLLEQKKVVPSAFFLKLYAKIKGAPNVQAGEYAMNASMSDAQAISVLRHGPKPSTDRLVIPEGFRLKQIAERVGDLPGMSANKFYELATNGTVHSDFEPAGSTNLEGLLFPDTYLLSSSDTELTLLQRMVNEFDNQANLLNLNSAPGSVGHTPYETIIIASMIEAEAKIPGDRGKVSQVIENRLFDAMPLQIDSTVLYAMGNNTTSLSTGDLKIQSPYNTYTNKGLPPAPIDSPGAASLQAALQPTPGPWLYYVVTGADGSESFGTTLAQQNANIALARSRGLPG